MSLTIGVDVGGTKVAAGVVDAHGRILEKLKRPTPSASPEHTAQVIADAVIELAGRYSALAVGIGAAGFVDAVRSGILFAPNLAWRNEPLKQQVQSYVGLPVVVENDANAAAWAETMLGAARGHEHVMLIAVGTGIGAGIVINGGLYRGQFGIAGEPGHYRVVPDGRLCGCGNRGCWEQYASGNALVAEAREFARRSPGPAVRLLQLGGGTAEGISGPVVTEAAHEGDAAALRCFEIVGGWLGQGLAALAAILDPGCFVIGGGVSEAGDLLIRPARAAFEDALTGSLYRPHAEIRLAELGADAGVIGAADLARRALDGDAPAAEVHSTAPLSGPEPRDGPSPRRSTRTTKPPTNAAIARSAAQPGTDQPASVAASRYAGPPNSAVQAPLATESRCGSGGGGGGT
jgi:glucokinase